MPPVYNEGWRRDEQRRSGIAGIGVAPEVAGGSGGEAISGRVLPATWIEAGGSVPVEEEATERRAMAGDQS